MTDAAKMRFPPPRTISPEAQAALSGPPARPQYPAREDIQGWLDHVADADAALLQFLPEAAGVAADEVDLDGSRVFVHRPEDVAPGGPVYLALHPGALITMGGEVCRRLGALSATAFGVEVWNVDYRMPPLHPYPAALDDCTRAYRHLLETRSPEQIVVGGVSAGGNLAAALLLRARDEGLPMPSALYLGTPELDLTESGDTFQVLADADSALATLREVNALYAAGHDLSHPYLSPLFGDVSRFPSTLLTSGTRDLFLSNTVQMHRKLRAAGVAADLHVFEGMPHAGFTGSAPEDLELVALSASFVRAHLGGS